MARLRLVWLALVSSLMGMNVYAQQPGAEVETEGNVTRVRNTVDFIAHMGDPVPADSPKTKEAVLKALEPLTSQANRDCNPALVKGWNLLDQTTALSQKEKADWVERRMADLPVPFLMLAAVCRSDQDPKRGMELYLLSRIRLTIDAAKCADPSAEAASMLVVARLLPHLNIGRNRSEVDDEKYQEQFLNMMRETMPRALALHKKTENHLPRPWWVAHAGIQELTDTLANSSEKSKPGDPAMVLFKPETEWAGIEREILGDFQKQFSSAN